jgi:RNA polymerase sigma-70 factor (ECF subfamily)
MQDHSSRKDEELMMRYRDGDVSAFDVLVRRHRDGLLNFLYRMTGVRQVAEEVQADAWLKIHRAASRYEPRARFSTYLYTVAYRQCLTVLGAKANKVKPAGVDPERLDSSPLGGGGSPAWSNPERQVLLDDQMKRLNQEVAGLPEAHRAAFLLYYVEGLSCHETAEVLDLTAKEVKGRLAYARRLLRERVATA